MNKIGSILVIRVKVKKKRKSRNEDIKYQGGVEILDGVPWTYHWEEAFKKDLRRSFKKERKKWRNKPDWHLEEEYSN